MSVVRSRATAASLVAIALAGGYLAQGTFAAGTPANKVAGAGSTTEVVHAAADTKLLVEHVKINAPTDLLLSASAECAIVTQVTNSANGQTERAFGSVKMYVTIDGKRVPVAKGDTDAGEVVFCSRAQEQQWTDGDTPADDQNDTLRQYLSTRDANAFNWMALNVGENYQGTADNVHEIILWADWDVQASAEAMADAVVGNRTLILEPVKAAVGEQVTELG
jgi:hypothetical protein